jgi:hypothetical protein
MNRDGFREDDGIIHHDADRHQKRHQRHHVQAEPGQRHPDRGPEKGHRQAHRGPYRKGRAEEQGHYCDHQHKADQPVLDQHRQAVAHDRCHVLHNLDAHATRQMRGLGSDQRRHRIKGAQRVGVERFLHLKQDRGRAVDEGAVLGRREGFRQRRNLAQRQGSAIGQAENWCVGQFSRAAPLFGKAQRQIGGGGVKAACRQIEALRGQHGGQRGGGQPVAVHQAARCLDADGARADAGPDHPRHTGQRGQPVGEAFGIEIQFAQWRGAVNGDRRNRIGAVQFAHDRRFGALGQAVDGRDLGAQLIDKAQGIATGAQGGHGARAVILRGAGQIAQPLDTLQASQSGRQIASSTSAAAAPR